jgi:mannose-6-phosphate isomerase-like protein (cupin superfamily)
MSETPPQVGRLDRARLQPAHGGTVLVQPLFGDTHVPWPRALAYPPCWAVLDPGMAVEAHCHPSAEVYVFVSGTGVMRVASVEIPVSSGMAVTIPPDAVHDVCNDPAATSPLVWLSVGWRPDGKELS